jgi:hypothetical protein
MESANVSSIDALRAFRAAMIKFAESVDSAVTDADADVRFTLTWLERDQSVFWKNQVRKRHEALERAKEALRHKELFKSPHGGRPSVVEEQKVVARCKAALEQAEQKLLNVKRSIHRLHKQMTEFQGQIQRLASAAQSDVPAAVADLDRMVARLDEYVGLRTPTAAASVAEPSAARMARGEATEAPTQLDWKALRASTPAPSARASAAKGIVSFGPWKSGQVAPMQSDLLRTMGVSPRPHAPDAHNTKTLLTLAERANEHEQIYLERIAPAFSNDSGWHVGCATSANPTRFHTLTIAELLSMRPDLEPLLALPAGFLVGLDKEGIAIILDTENRDLWSEIRPSAPSVGANAAQEDSEE